MPNCKPRKIITSKRCRQIHWDSNGIFDFALSYSVYPRVDLKVFMPRSQAITKQRSSFFSMSESHDAKPGWVEDDLEKDIDVTKL